MIFNTIDDFKLPENLMKVLEEEEYYEDDRFDPVLL